MTFHDKLKKFVLNKYDEELNEDDTEEYLIYCCDLITDNHIKIRKEMNILKENYNNLIKCLMNNDKNNDDDSDGDDSNDDDNIRENDDVSEENKPLIFGSLRNRKKKLVSQIKQYEVNLNKEQLNFLYNDDNNGKLFNLIRQKIYYNKNFKS